jgi:6-phospho-beta-glucosidase
MSLVKDAERTAIEAAATRSRSLAVRALALHPLVASVGAASTLLERSLGELPDLARAFGAGR